MWVHVVVDDGGQEEDSSALLGVHILVDENDTGTGGALLGVHVIIVVFVDGLRKDNNMHAVVVILVPTVPW